jgi:hypothetical protein
VKGRILLIGGLTVFADGFIFVSVVTELSLLPYHLWKYFFSPLLAVLSGLFILGLFIGAFYDFEYAELIRRILRIIVASHGLFLSSFPDTLKSDFSVLPLELQEVRRNYLHPNLRYQPKPLRVALS